MSETMAADWRTAEAGRAFDSFLAERSGAHAMPVAKKLKPCPDGRPGCAVAHWGWFDANGVEVPRYSTDEGAARRLGALLRARPDGHRFALRVTEYPDNRAYATFAAPDDDMGEEANGKYATPLAICRAFLAALERA